MHLLSNFVAYMLLFNKERGDRLIQSLTVTNGKASFNRYEFRDITSAMSGSYSNLRSREGFRETIVPLQMVLISFEKDSPSPYRICFFSSGNYQYIEMDRDMYDAVISGTELHTHNTYELSLVRKGSLLQRIESVRHIYPQGSCFLLNRNVRHNEEYDSSFCTVTLSLSEEYLKQTLMEEFPSGDIANDMWGRGTDLGQFLNAELNSTDTGKKTYIDFIPTGNDAQVFDMFDSIALSLLDPEPGSVFLIKSYLCRLLSLLSRKDIFSTVPVELGTAAEGHIFAEIAELMEVSKGRISRQKLTNQLHYSGSYLNRIVKKYTGLNLTGYSNSVSMRYASSMLLNTDLTISEIAEELSFSNRRYFYKEFEKAYGITPRKYRSEHRKQK